MIDWGMWAQDEETARQSWIARGILKDEPGWVFTANYHGIQITTSWGGQIVKTPAVLDAQCNVVTPAQMVPGWHANCRVTGVVEEAMTAGLPQHDADGKLLPLWERTWASYIFGLTEDDVNPVTGFPSGYKNSTTGVKYCDPSLFRSPSNVWA